MNRYCNNRESIIIDLIAFATNKEMQDRKYVLYIGLAISDGYTGLITILQTLFYLIRNDTTNPYHHVYDWCVIVYSQVCASDCGSLVGRYVCAYIHTAENVSFLS